MSRVRIDFLNWRPDAEDFGNQGLTVADNVVHEPEGYKPIYLKSAGAFATIGDLRSITSVVTKPIGGGGEVGSAGDLLSAFLNNSNQQLGIALNGSTLGTSSTGFPVAFSTAGTSAAITFFDVCELDGRVFFVAEAEMQKASPSTVTSIAVSGYATAGGVA